MARTCTECGLPMKWQSEDDGQPGSWYCDHEGHDDVPDDDDYEQYVPAADPALEPEEWSE